MRLAHFALFMVIAANSAFAVERYDLAASGLSSLVLDGRELHSSLVTAQLDEKPIRHVPRDVLQGNPHLSTDAEFVKAIARSGSQGKLGGEGIRAALYALYLGDSQVGFYGLEAASARDADRLEVALRTIWSHNVSIDRARVHRGGLVLVVAWHDGVSRESWEAVNAAVSERLVAP
ncbi:MAG: hypothetical protein LC667_19660 [Thioalkalivibrio sp.]|nr:hypothetical protein [Thioalkalivibrio sp.]